MQTTEAIQRRINSAQDLLSIVKTMKTLAAVSIRQYEKAVESLTDYYRTIEMGFQVLLRTQPEDLPPVHATRATRTGVIVFGSDQGMCGQFNEQIAAFALSQLAASKVAPTDRRILALGTRLIAYLGAVEAALDDGWHIPSSVVGINPLIQDLVLKIDAWRSEQDITRVLLFYNQPQPGGLYRPHCLHLLPVSRDHFKSLAERPWNSRSLPTFTLDWQQLFSALLRQYVFVSLFRAFAESLMSENASRLAAMQSAERNIKDHLEELDALFHQQRQQAITAELLDIVSGFETLTVSQS